MIILSIIVFILFLLILFCVYSTYKLNTYIETVESKFKEQITLTQNLKQSLKELTADGFLLDDGRLKKMLMQTERNQIYNGAKIDESDYEL